MARSWSTRARGEGMLGFLAALACCKYSQKQLLEHIHGTSGVSPFLAMSVSTSDLPLPLLLSISHTPNGNRKRIRRVNSFKR